MAKNMTPEEARAKVQQAMGDTLGRAVAESQVYTLRATAETLRGDLYDRQKQNFVTQNLIEHGRARLTPEQDSFLSGIEFAANMVAESVRVYEKLMEAME